MPISKVQALILRTIAANRSPDSYLAGATVLHRAADTPRFSRDLDFFHDVEDSVAESAETDAKTLKNAGYGFEWLLRTPTYQRAIVSAEDEAVRIEWAQDSAFRFFPVQKDDMCGYRLHDADAAVNKVLALAGRQEVRDFVDVLHLHETYLSLGAMAWAACGKDPGFTPDFLLDHAGRHVAYTQNDVNRLELRSPLDLRDMKKKWLEALAEARRLTAKLPSEELGCLYLMTDQVPVIPDPGAETFRLLIRHSGSVRGAWPTVTENREDRQV
jgi:hypothetical protein